jgi:PmbA protein
MDSLLEMAGNKSDKAEIFSVNSSSDNISFENAHLKDIESRMQSGVGLRLIKNNRLGFAYTMNLIHREELVQNALDSLKGGVEGAFEFPSTKGLPSLNTYDSSIEELSNSEMVDECNRICGLLTPKTGGQSNVSARRSVSDIRIMNTSGTDLSAKFSLYALSAQILYPYSYASLSRSLISKSFEKAAGGYLDYLADTYDRSLNETAPEGRDLKILFLPETMYVLMWRLQSAVNGRSIYQGISPVAEKTGEKIFDEKLSVYNDPLNDSLPYARAFDDEGTPCGLFPVIEKGVLKNFCQDLYFARKLKTSPTGHGFRGSVSSAPAPSLGHLIVSAGDISFPEIVRSIDRGIIVAGALGAHSGNIPNGDFSIGISPGLYVEGGKIAGHVKDAMAAGNIYDSLRNIIAIEDKLHLCFGGNFPAVLFGNINITTRR